jgi:hypothetical protein
MVERATDDDLELLGDLGVDTSAGTAAGLSPKEQRIIAGFEEIERFVEEHGRAPGHGEGRDIFERIYAVRLDRIRQSAECREVLKDRDPRGLLDREQPAPPEEQPDDEDLLSSLGVDAAQEEDVTKLVHVRPRDEIRAAEEVAQRNPCEDFDQFRPLFEKVQRELKSGKRLSKKYKDDAKVRRGDFFILDGQKILVADLGEQFVNEHGHRDRRLRVIYDNGTESDLLLRSLQRALNKDKTSRRITLAGASLPFPDEDDLAAGCIYVLRSLSDHPFIVENRELVHKIGVTVGDAKYRIAGAKKDPTYLLAGVELVAEYKLANINRSKLESLIHRFFADARLDLQLKDRFGEHVEPQEWFLVPLPVIDETIEKIEDGSIVEFRYDPEQARLSRE